MGLEFKPDPKPVSTRKKKLPPHKASPERKAEVRKKKATECRVCQNPDGYKIHAHHLIREGGQWKGSFTEGNIVGLCAACHQGLHAGDDRIKKILRVRLTQAEVDYTDRKAYTGYVDEIYWRVRPVVEDGTAA